MKLSVAVDKYIATFPLEVQEKLQQIRKTIIQVAPDAEEVISYGMPAYKQGKVLVYFAAHKSHIGFYPTSSGIQVFSKEFTDYKWSKGAVQFPYAKPLPLDLVEKITRFRVSEIKHNL